MPRSKLWALSMRVVATDTRGHHHAGSLLSRGFLWVLSASITAFASAGCMKFAWPDDDENLARCAFSSGMPALATDGGTDDRISTQATDRMAQVPQISVQGSGSDVVGRVAFTDGVGSVDVNCTRLGAAIYQRGTYEEGHVYHALAANIERWYPFRFYCKDNGNLDVICYDGTDGTDWTCDWSADGRCLGSGDWIESRVRFPRFDSPWPRPITGYTIEGPSISLPSDGRGTITVDGVEQQLFAFGNIDCGDCEPTRWHHLHVLTWAPVEEQADLATLVLLDDQPDLVQMGWRLGFPGFLHLEPHEFPATFTTP